jgi:hypothetical protein
VPEDAVRNDPAESVRLPVLEVFGIKLSVSNPRLARLLTMDAREALTTDVRQLYPSLERPESAEPLEDAGDGLEDADPARSADFQRLVREAAGALGFGTTDDGLWLSPTGAAIVTRTVSAPLSFASAARCVAGLARRREALGGDDATALVVVEGQETADVLKVAVRQADVADVMRVVSLGNLLELRRLAEFGTMDHMQAVVLLVPMADIDVGEILSIMRTSSVDEFPEALG